MHSPVLPLIAFTLCVVSIGVLLMTIFEEICSTNKVKLRFYLLAGLSPLIVLGLTTPSLIRSYFAVSSGSGWIIIITSIGALAVFAFALGIGCVACLWTYRERSSLSRDQLIVYLLLCLGAGVVAPLVAIAIDITDLIYLHSTAPH